MRHEIPGCEVLQELVIEHRLRITDATYKDLLWECRVRPKGEWMVVAGMRSNGEGVCGTNLKEVTQFAVHGRLFDCVAACKSK